MDSLWNSQVVSPSNWVEVLAVEIAEGELGRSLKAGDFVVWARKACQRDKSSTNQRVLSWLDDNALDDQRGARNVSTVLSKLRANHDCRRKPGGIMGDLVDVIAQNVSLKSAICFFEWRAYEALRYFLPDGGISYTDRERPIGLYQATRPSFGVPDKLTRSAFLFYENEIEDERLWGYGYPGKDKVLRFKERRIITDAEPRPRLIFSGGLVFINRQCFILIGASYETEFDKQERDLKASDIKHMQLVYYIFDDDHNNEVIRGFKPTVLRSTCDPVVPVVELERVTTKPIKWDDIDDSGLVQIGTFDAVGDLEKYTDRLKPNYDQNFNMYRVTTYRDKS